MEKVVLFRDEDTSREGPSGEEEGFYFEMPISDLCHWLNKIGASYLQDKPESLFESWGWDSCGRESDAPVRISGAYHRYTSHWGQWNNPAHRSVQEMFFPSGKHGHQDN
jgi:hypothetical protein